MRFGSGSGSQKCSQLSAFILDSELGHLLPIFLCSNARPGCSFCWFLSVSDSLLSLLGTECRFSQRILYFLLHRYIFPPEVCLTHVQLLLLSTSKNTNSCTLYCAVLTEMKPYGICVTLCVHTVCRATQNLGS